jgi:hypothetical protein
MVGGLPLAITHIGGYMGESECSLLEFREISEERNPSIWFGEAPATLFQYNKRLEAVWDFALDELPADAKTIINIMAFLNPDFIPDALLHMEFDKLASSKKSSRMRQAEYVSASFE